MNRAKMPGVYRIDVGDEFYVGSSINMQRRFREHLQLLRRGCHSNAFVQSTWNACGNATFSVLQHVPVLIERNTRRRDIDRVVKPAK